MPLASVLCVCLVCVCVYQRCSHTTLFCPETTICVLILTHMCPRTAIYLSSYY
jgi:hypothetical protein